MTHSIDDNGILSIGSKLQSQLGLSIVSKLGTPTNITYDYSDGGTIITYDEMEGVLGNELMSNQETIDVLKRIYNGNGFIKVDGVPITNLKKVERDKKQFLKLVNSHSQSRRDVRGNALKNRIVSAINQITLAPQNQLVAQVPINMDEPKDAARDSKLGKAELHINSDNPETKFMMQVQNMVGKEVIGISAVSLKAFFGLSYYYNQKVQNLKDAILNKGNQDVLNALNELLFTNPLTGKITSLANIDIEQVYDLQFNDRFTTEFLNVPSKLLEWVKIDEVTGQEYFDFRQCINDIAKRVNRNDSALTISAIISAATDSRRVSIKPGEFRENG